MTQRRRLPDPRGLVVFEATARHASFGAAARALGMSQPAVSQRIARLEAEIGVALFRRDRRGIRLTAEGARLFETVGAAFAGIADVVAGIAGGRTTRGLALATDFGFAAFWLLPRLGTLKALLPETDVRVVVSQDAADPDAVTADLMILFGDGRWPGARAERLFAETVVPVAAPDLLAGRPPAAGVAGLPLLRLEGGGGRWLSWEDWFAARGIAPSGLRGLAFNDYSLVLQAALAGQGAALGWSPLVDDLLADGRLVPLGPPLATGRGYHLVARAGVRDEAVGMVRDRIAALAGLRPAALGLTPPAQAPA